MSRLPKQGGDNGTWGDILNDFLVQSHNPSGSIRDGAIGSSQIQDSAVSANKLSAPVNSILASAQTAVQSVNGKSGTAISIGIGDLAEAADAADGQALVKAGSTWSPVSVVSGGDIEGTVPDGSVGLEKLVGPVAPAIVVRLATDGTDQTGPLQAAIDSLPSTGGTVELAHFGDAIISGVTRPSCVILRGGGYGTTLRASPLMSPGAPMIDTVRQGVLDYSGSVHGCGLEALTLDGANASSTTGVTGLRQVNYVPGGATESSRATWLTGVKIKRCAVGLRLINDQGVKLSSVALHENAVGLYASDNAQLGNFDDVDFRGNDVGARFEASGAVITDAVLDAPYGNKFTRCHFEKNRIGIDIDGASSNTFDTCKWEQNTEVSVLVQQTGTKAPFGNVFINGVWNGNTDAPTVKHMRLLGGTRTTLIAGWMGSNANAGVEVATTHTHVLTFGTQIDCAITDPGPNMTRFRDPSTSKMTFRTTDNNTVSLMGIELVAGDAGGGRSAFYGAQGRARFGFNGSSSRVQVDDAGTAKDFSVNLNGLERARVTQTGGLALRDVAGTAPAAIAGMPLLYFDGAAMKARLPDGTIKTVTMT